MTNIYNKGRYRSGEWAKHLRPFLKTVSNRRWRRTTNDLNKIDLDQSGITPIKTKSNKRNHKRIAVKFKMKSIGDYTYSYKSKYKTLRSAKDAIERNNVIEAKILK